MATTFEDPVKKAYADWQAKATPWYMPTPKGNMEERQAEAAYSDALRSAHAPKPAGATGPISPSPVSQDTPTPATATLNSVMEVQRRRDAIAGTNTSPGGGSPTPPPGGQPAQEAQAQQGREVVPGAYAHGRGQYSDQAGGMGFSAGFTGKPNSQNDAAAEALSARSQQESANRLAQQQYQREVADAQAINAAGTQYAPNSGLQYQWMKDLRDPRTMALRNASAGSTIFRNKGEEMTANKARQARVAGVQAAIGSQMKGAQEADTERYQSDNTLAGNLGTEQMRQDGANQRSLAQMALEQQKNRTAAAQWGAENRGKSLVQAMQEQIATEQDPAKRQSIVQRLRDMQGGQTADPYLVVPGGQGVTEDGKPYNMPSSVFNRQTAQFVQQPQGQGRGLPQGMSKMVGTSGGKPVYEDANGNRYIAG